VADFGALAVILCAGALYGVGVMRVWDRAGRGRIIRSWQPACFAAALVAAGVALVSPLDGAADRSLTAHMAQHVVLISAAAPALAISAPLIALAYAFDPAGPAHLAGRWGRPHVPRGRQWAVLTAVALVVHTATVGVWHVPVAYDAALSNVGIHAFEHLTFLFTAAVLWWAALGTGRRSRRGAGVLVLFLTTLPMNALGLMMTLSRSPWYPEYVHGSVAKAVQDQQLAGVVMWGFGGVAALVGAFALFVSWLEGLERATPGRLVLGSGTPSPGTAP
jgi:cytochrome c oxidase assembly factor CtaG